ncbi:MAG: DEAD/DEAH box helicase, partial [Phycisphaerae bacterium]|nr:DEAD/DEAH box helicase [Phycisphaerae bacterium]
MDRGDVCTQFLERLEFDLYPFQEEALLAWFEAEQGVLVAAPTGMGKTLIAEAAIYEALVTGDRLYYTTPLIALTDQKFREFQDKAEDWGFRRDDVGLVTGNRKINPDARVRVVVAEILLNHLLGDPDQLRDVRGVVMDEFHYFNDFERGVVWELSLVLLPKHIRLMLLSATVGNSRQFLGWLSEKHDRKLRLVESQERRVPLEFCWVGDKLLTEQLPLMLAADDEANRAPALVFCFNREECWSVAERIKGVTLIDEPTRKRIDEQLDGALFTEGIGPKLKQMLLRGVAVHHAGVLPKYKEVVESLFLQKLIPFVICTETLAAGINLPARSVVLSELLKGKRGEKKLIAPSAAHQMFGRAGRPQFDKKGYVFALAHEDDVKIEKWRKKYEQIDPKTKDPGLLRAKKDLERKRPTRRKTEQYWTEGQFGTLIKAGPADLFSRSMIPYQVLIYLLLNTGSLQGVREFLSRRFNTPERLSKFQDQLDHMVKNLAAFGHLTVSEDGQSVQLAEGIESLLEFRSIDPLYGRFLAKTLVPASPQERLQALESVLPVPPVMSRAVRLPFLEPGPLQVNELEPTLLQLGIVITHEDGGVVQFDEDEGEDYMPDDRDEPRPMSLPEMLAALYQAKLASPEDVPAQPQWIVGGILEQGGDFYKY